MSGVPVLWLCGPPGVGKSTAAWALFGEYARRGVVAGYVDIDQLGIRYPAPEDERGNTRVKAVNLGAVLRNYRAAGATRVVVSGVVLPAEVPTFEATVGPTVITWVRLQADPERLHDRFACRDGPARLLPDVDRRAEVLARSRFPTTSIETTHLGVPDLAEAVETAVPGWPALPVQAGGTATSGHPTGNGSGTSRDTSGRVLLLCGPRAVGTSTVGWEVFQRLQRHGTAAYVDLAQVGFVGAASALPLGRHRVRAHNLAALARTYHRGGASVVVAVGSVLGVEEAHQYAAALPPGSLTVYRSEPHPTSWNGASTPARQPPAVPTWPGTTCAAGQQPTCNRWYGKLWPRPSCSNEPHSATSSWTPPDARHRTAPPRS